MPEEWVDWTEKETKEQQQLRVIDPLWHGVVMITDNVIVEDLPLEGRSYSMARIIYERIKNPK